MRTYQIWLADTLIGTTLLEKADAPMGVVVGEIIPTITNFGYDFIKRTYAANGIGFTFDFPEDKIIVTFSNDLLTVVTPEGKVIESLGNQVGGMENEGFSIRLEGIAYPFYAEEFPKHCADYAAFLEKER